MAIIVIDPGHGGTDSGAKGEKELIEKDLTLRIALKTAEFLRQVGVDVRLTRTTDTTLSIAQRSSYANRVGADYFLCIHINAGGGSGYQSYIYNLSHTATILANIAIHRKAAGYFASFGLPDLGVQKGEFYVLQDTRMSGSILECGFIDHPKDAELLRNHSFINGLALAIAQGVALAFGYKEPEGPTTQISKYFVDVVEGMEEAQPYIDFLFEKGIMMGDGNGHFLPMDHLDRKTFAMVMGRALQYLASQKN